MLGTESQESKNSSDSTHPERCILAQTRLALRPKEAARALGIGERLLWSLTNQGRIPHVRLGKAIVYPVGELDRWLAERAAEGVRGE